jgi:predicted transcriptional regulator
MPMRITPEQREEALREMRAMTPEEFAKGAEVHPPTPLDQVMVVMTVRLPQPVIQRARELAEERSVPVRELLRDWIQAGLAQAEESNGAVVPVDVLMNTIARYQEPKAS